VSVVRRVNRPADNFTMISNEFVRDSRLSFHARGVGSWMLSHAAGWETTTEAIAKDAGVGRDQIRRALTELEGAGYLRRTRDRSAEGKLGPMVYEIQCSPFEPVSAGQDQRLENQALEDQALVSRRHKKTTSKNTIQENPSGGAAAAAPEAEHVEDAVRKTKQPEAAGLFEVERPPAREPHGAAAVVAAYVVAYRKAHGDTDPIKSHKGRVARDARQILNAGQATEQELVVVADRLGAGDFANLGAELAISRRTSPKPGRPGMAHVAPNDDPRWEAYSGPVLTGWTEDEERDFQEYLARNAG
jgi:hypothetical protein